MVQEHKSRMRNTLSLWLLTGLACATVACSSAPPQTQASASSPASVATPHEEPRVVAVPPATRDPFVRRVKPPAQPTVTRVTLPAVNYVKPARDPFVAPGGTPNQQAAASRATDPDAGGRISKPAPPAFRLIAIEKSGGQFLAVLSARGERLTAREGEYVLGCRVARIDADGVAVTRAGHPFRLSLKRPLAEAP